VLINAVYVAIMDMLKTRQALLMLNDGLANTFLFHGGKRGTSFRVKLVVQWKERLWRALQSRMVAWGSNSLAHSTCSACWTNCQVGWEEQGQLVY